MGEMSVLFSGSQLCTFNDDYCSQLLADCCTAHCLLSPIKPLLPSSRTSATGRDTPPLRAAAHRAAGLPDNVTLLRPQTTRSRRCHLQLGRVCFLLCLTLSQLEESSSPGWGEMGAKLFEETLGQKGWSAFCSSAQEERELLQGTGRDAQVFSQALPQILVAFFSILSPLMSLLSFPFLPNSHLQLPLSLLDAMVSSSFRCVRILSEGHKSMRGDRNLRQG